MSNGALCSGAQVEQDGEHSPRVASARRQAELIDAWNNVPHVPGARTIGGAGGDFAIVGPDWSGELPDGVSELRMPTNLSLIGGRTYVAGPDDIPAVHDFQGTGTASSHSRHGTATGHPRPRCP